MSKIKFVLNDENVENSYGFHVITTGIKLDRFKENPVMLSDHQNRNAAVLGRWQELEAVNGQLLGVPEFDMEDPDAKAIAGKVDRGFIKGASMGLLFKSSDMVFLDGKIVLKECELVEGTIIPVPSNKNALRLYLQEGGDPLSEEDIKSMCLSLQDELPNLNPPNDMKKVVLSLAAYVALGYDDAPTEGIDASEVSAKIVELQAKVTSLTQDNANLKTANQALKETTEAAALAAATKLVDDAVEQGRITADKKEAFLAMAKSDFAMAEATLSAIPTKKNLSAQVNNTTPAEVKSMDDFQALGLEAQLAWKEANPEAYKNLLK